MRWLEALLAQNLWLALLIWATLYVLDYVQTLRGAELYQRVGSQHILIEGSYELTPYFQPDIDRMRKVSYRFLIMLALSLAAMMLVWWLTSLISIPELFLIMAGALILRSVAVQTQHIRNIASFRYVMRHPDQISGKIEYSRPLTLYNRSVEFALFGGVYLVMFALTGSWFAAGGALGCLAIAAQMLRWRRKLAPAKRETT